jgi:hypothetical protein
MQRQKIPQIIETQLLTSCRRRCCICYGLERDFRVKQGQIAHLDGNRDNNKIDNLAFLCLAHHDNYDSKTSQSKGFTINEVKAFRDEINEFILNDFNKPILDNTQVNFDIFSGIYVQDNELAHSELEIKNIGGNIIKVKGYAFWGKLRDFGPSIGELDFAAYLDKNKAVFTDDLYGNEYKLSLEFLDSKLIALEDYLEGYFGLNVSFDGTYIKQK